MENILKFWQWFSETFEVEEYDDIFEEYGNSIADFDEENLAVLSEESLSDLFYNLINIYMDVSGNESYGDLYDLMTEDLGIPESVADSLID